MQAQRVRVGARFASRLQSSPEAAQQALWLHSRQALGDWLGQWTWSHFVTLTFRYPHSPEAALAKYTRWVRRVKQRAQQAVDWFQVLERGAAGLWHLHVLLRGTPHVPNNGLVEAWQWGRADASTYDPRKGASYYLTKAVGTDVAEYDFDLGPPNRN